MAFSLRSIVLLAALLYGATAEAAEECKAGEQCAHDDVEESALLQTKIEPQPKADGDTEKSAKIEPEPKVDGDTEKSQPNLVDLLAKFDDLQAKVKMVKGAVLTQNVTTDPDDENDNDARELLSTRATHKATKEGCPPQPSGWNQCAWGKVYEVPAYCGGSAKRYTLNNGDPVNYKACAFLTAQTSVCSNYFYTTSTSDAAGGVCKCCKEPPSTGSYYGSSQCNHVYYASPSCQLR